MTYYVHNNNIDRLKSYLVTNVITSPGFSSRAQAKERSTSFAEESTGALVRIRSTNG